MQKNRTRVLVLDANQRSALAVTRSLGKNPNLCILTADTLSDALAANSHFSEDYFQHPSIYTEPELFKSWLIDFVKRHDIQWIFPVTEVSSQSILQLQTVLAPCRIPFANYDTVMTLANKWNLIELAEKLGIPYPNTQYFDCSADVALSSIAHYPAVIKPCLSRINTNSGWLDTSVHIVESEVALERLLVEKAYLRNHPFMIQEFIPGHGAGIFALYNKGAPVTFFAHRRLREKPPSGGVSTLSESVKPNPQMLQIAKKLLDAVNWHGVAMVEFRVAANGTPFLMEVNTRFWGSLQLAIDSGVDFPSLLYRVCADEIVEPVISYKVGQRLRWLLGDVDSLYLVMRDKRSFSTADKLKRLVQFCTPHPLSTRHEIDRWNDPGPMWYELKAYLRSLMR